MDNEFIRHLPCSVCGSSDANSLYSDGHTYCFSCETRSSPNDTFHKHQMTRNVCFKGSAQRLHKRNIDEETNEFYKIYRDGETLRFPYYTIDGILKGFKVKTKNKDFYYEGESTDTFFGQYKFPSTGKRIILSEGEIDTASIRQAFGNWPICSLPHGAASAKKDVKKQIPFLQGYEEIVLFLDNDDAGRKATEEICSILPPGKVKIARLDNYKDASDALQANDSQAIRKAIWDAKDYRPDGIVDGSSLYEAITTPNPPCLHKYEIEGLNQKLGGIHAQQLVTITGATGGGKTTFVRQLATHLLVQGERVGFLGLEESNRRTALGLMSCALGKPFHLKEYAKEELEEAYKKTIANWNLFLFDGFGSFQSDLIYNRIEYLAVGLDCKIIFLDHLSILVSGLKDVKDERRLIDQVMTDLRSLVERTGITLFLVSHLRRGSNDSKSAEEGGRIGLSQLRGSHSISQISDSCLTLESNQQSEDERNLTTLRILKNRFNGQVGIASKLNYNKETCKFEEVDNEPDFNPSTDF